MAVNHNVNPRPLTAEEKENRARGVYDSFATYVVFCGHCRYVRKTNMYIMRAAAFIDELKARGEVCPHCGRQASSSSDTRTAAGPRTREGLLFCADSGTFARRLLHIAENGKFRFPARIHML